MGATSGEPGPTDAWITLAGLARQTSRIRLGTLVNSATFRLPGPLAVAVAQVDRMSGGRVELGLGAGWFEGEHAAYGIPFPELGERFERLTEQLEIVTGLWGTLPGERYGFTGKHYTLTDSPALPKPVQQPRPPVIVGGKGPRRTPRLAARFADEINVPFSTTAEVVAQFARSTDCLPGDLVASPGALVRSIAHTSPSAVGRPGGGPPGATIGREVDDDRENGLAGTPRPSWVDTLGALARADRDQPGYLQLLDLADLAQLELIAA
jgi:alkanesulfonate monooxygenase